MKTLINILNEIVNPAYVFYTGLWDKNDWDKYWKNKKLIKDKLTNVSDDYNIAQEFSGDNLIVVQISNVPVEAIVGVRKNNYNNDEDYVDLTNKSNEEKIKYLNKYSMFLLNLYPYKNKIKINKK